MNSVNNGAIVERIIAHRAYSNKRNIGFCNNVNVNLVAILKPNITNERSVESEGFTFNEDCDGLFCPKGELSSKKAHGLLQAIYG